MIRCVAILLLSVISINAQSGRKISFAEAKKLLNGEQEGNIENTPGNYTKTKLSDGRLLEIFYPVKPTQVRRGKAGIIPGYGLLYASSKAAEQAVTAKSMLTELMPDSQDFINRVPQLISQLEKRIGYKLDYSAASFKKLDKFVIRNKRQYSPNSFNIKLFEELTAYYGESLRKHVNGEWKIYEKGVSINIVQKEPNISFLHNGKKKYLPPWSRIMEALFDSDFKESLSKLYNKDIELTAQSVSN